MYTGGACLLALGGGGVRKIQGDVEGHLQLHSELEAGWPGLPKVLFSFKLSDLSPSVPGLLKPGRTVPGSAVTSLAATAKLFLLEA